MEKEAIIGVIDVSDIQENLSTKDALTKHFSYSHEELFNGQKEDVHVSKVMKVIREKVKVNKHKRKKLHVYTEKLLTQRKKLIIVKDLLYRRIKGPKGSAILQLVIPEVLKKTICS